MSYMYFNSGRTRAVERETEVQAVTSVIMPRIQLQKHSATTSASTPILGSVPRCGNLDADYESSIDLIALSARVRF